MNFDELFIKNQNKLFELIYPRTNFRKDLTDDIIQNLYIDCKINKVNYEEENFINFLLPRIKNQITLEKSHDYKLNTNPLVFHFLSYEEELNFDEKKELEILKDESQKTKEIINVKLLNKINPFLSEINEEVTDENYNSIAHEIKYLQKKKKYQQKRLKLYAKKINLFSDKLLNKTNAKIIYKNEIIWIKISSKNETEIEGKIISIYSKFYQKTIKINKKFIVGL